MDRTGFLEKMEKDIDFKWNLFSDLVLFLYKEKCRKKPTHYIFMDMVIEEYNSFSNVGEVLPFYKTQLRKNHNYRKNLYREWKCKWCMETFRCGINPWLVCSDCNECVSKGCEYEYNRSLKLE